MINLFYILNVFRSISTCAQHLVLRSSLPAQGQFGEVFKGVYKPTGEAVAVKTCREAVSEEVKRMFLREGRILKQYNHVNIVHFVGIAAQAQPVMIVMEFVSGM